MTNFDELLALIHTGASATAPSFDNDDKIIIKPDRTFEIQENFNTIIAYEGDVNSQVVTFMCEKTVEGHDLSKCQEKRLRWKNVASGHEGSSKLSIKTEGEKLNLEWKAPPEAFTKSGGLEISITFFDIYEGKIAYSWNTAVFKDLKVGVSLDSVGYDIQSYGEKYIPSKNEILTINTETRAIMAPTGYNHIFCHYGDVGTSVIYFQVNRYIRGIDLLDENTIFRIYWKITGLSNVEDSTNTKNLYAVELSDRDSEGLVNIIWNPSPAITNNSLFYSGKIVFQFEVQAVNKVWRTATYNNLEIGKSEFSEFVTDLPAIDGNVNGYIIDGAITLEDKVVNTVAGVVKLRTCSENSPILMRKNELVIENDAMGMYKGIKIGVIDGESSINSPYVAYTPDTIIRLHGGDASGN